MKRRADLAITAAVAAPMIYLYLSFISWLVSDAVIAHATTLDLLVLFFQAGTLAIVMSVKRLRDEAVPLVGDLFSLEVFAFPILAAAAYCYGDSSLLSRGFAIMFAWPSAMLCVVPTYVIYKIVHIMWSKGKLVHLIPSALAFFALLAFVAHATGSASAPAGLAGLSNSLFSSLLQTRAIGITPQAEIAGIPLYVALLLYAGTQALSSTPGAWNSVLVLALVCTAASVGLALVAAYFGVYLLLAFGVTGSVILAAIGWVTHAR